MPKLPEGLPPINGGNIPSHMVYNPLRQQEEIQKEEGTPRWKIVLFLLSLGGIAYWLISSSEKEVKSRYLEG